MARKNLITNPSFKITTPNTLETDWYTEVQGWTAVNGATFRTAADGAYFGSTYLNVKKAALGGSGVQTSLVEVPMGNIGLPYAASVYLRVPITQAESANLLLKLVWCNTNGEPIGEDSSEILTLGPTGIWSRESVIGHAPVGAVYVRLSVTQLVGGTAGKAFHLDAVLLEQSTYVGGYLDNISQAEEKKLVDLALMKKYSAGTFQGMDLNADVTIGDLVLNSIDENGVVWVCTDIEGWWGHAEPEIPDIQRGVEDGSYDVTGRYKARTLTLKGVIMVQDQAQLTAARDTLIAATNLVRRGVWLRTNEEPTRAAFVRLSGRPQITTINARGRTEFAIGLKAADPIKYKWNDASLDGTELIDIPRISIPTAGTDVYTVIRRSAVGGVCTITTSTAHGYAVGQMIVVSNVSSAYNGTFKITAVTSDTISYNPAGATEEASTSSGGTVVNKSQVTVYNDGTADVRAIFTITGPIGTGSTITNSTTGESLKLVQQLRGSGPIARVQRSELYNNVATLETIDAHQLIVGDTIEVYGLGEPFDTVLATVKSVTTTVPYTFSYNMVGPDTSSSLEDGGVSLKYSDILTINTYDRSVTYNGDIIGHRSKVDTLVDWIKLAPGANIVTFEDSIDPFEIIYKDFADATGIATLTTSAAHFMVPGQKVTVSMNEEATLIRKQLYDNVITLKTSAPHGFSVGDSIDVLSTELSVITKKQLVGDTVTLTAANEHGIAIGDTVIVGLNESSTITSKSSTANVVTLQTENPHGASVLDQVTIKLPTTASVSAKTLVSNVATVTTAAAHNYSVGDSITITLPLTASVVTKYISGSVVVMTTSGAHGFSVNDRISITLPTTATPISASYLGGSTNRVTLTTSAPHGFIPGDVISIDLGISPTQSVVSKSASATVATITTASTHNFSVGEQITISGVGIRYDGVRTITAVNSGARTVSFASSGSVEASSSSTGSVTNNTYAAGYNGTKVVESVTTGATNTLTYYYYGQDGNVASSIIGSAPTLTNVTNSSIDGAVTITSVPSVTQFAYTKVS